MLRRRTFVSVLALLLVMTAFPAGAQEGIDRSDRPIPDQVSDLKLDTPITASGADVLEPSLWTATGPQRVIVHLSTLSLAASKSKNPTKQLKDIARQQDAFIKRAEKDGATVLARVSKVLNAVFLEVDASDLDAIAGDFAVTRVAPVGDYQLDLDETVPYIGGSQVQANGVDGSGVTVAVLDSGIDYNHAALGGSGDVADYLANDPNIIEPGTFPTAKVVGGYDFVGSAWAPGGTEAPDPDPIDDGPASGHGTHVSDIIAGAKGVAPGASLYAVKVCSSVSTSCSGIALIQGMDFAVDPNGDGKTKDHVDIVNMSLGSTYGQPFDDDLSLAVDNATALGVLTVASAGNSADKPYITGTPSAAPTALSVAQTQVPSAELQLIALGGNEYAAVFQPWAVLPTAPISGPVQYGDGAGGNLDGCASFAPGSLNGLIVLVDRGSCNFSRKIQTVGEAGGLVGIIGLVDPSAPFSGGDGGDPVTIPGYMISQADSNAMKAQVGSIATVDPANGLPLSGQMVGSSSRGPSNDYQQIKPEIGAPGASVSAIAGSGTDTGPFGGTSGAAPMVSGSAALLMSGFKTNQKSNGGGNANGRALTPGQTKALLMNNAETNIDIDPFSGLAEITRIGGGEVRVNWAMDAPAAAWDANAPQAGLSFGMVEVDDVTTITRTIQVHNFSNKKQTYSVTPTFRFADDQASGAVSVSAPSKVSVKPGLGRDLTFNVTITIDGSKLPANVMNSGSEGASGAALTANEYDGYLVLDNGNGHTMNVPWHVLPRQAAKVVASQSTGIASGFPTVIGLDNQGAGIAQNDAYALLATSPNIPEGPKGGQSPTPDLAAVGINTFPVPAGVICSANDSFIWAFAVATHEEQSHLLPVSHQIVLDTNQDGIDDYVVLNRDLSGLGTISDGRQLTWAVDLNTGGASAFFFAEHATNTGNTVLLICGEQIGLTGTDMLATNVDMDVITQDFYYGGPGDEILGLTVTPLGEGFYGVPSDVDPFTNDPSGLAVYDYGLFPGNTPEQGLLLFTNGDRGSGAHGGATDATDHLIFTP